MGVSPYTSLQATIFLYTEAASKESTFCATFVVLQGPVTQKKCPPGTYQPEEGAGSCKVCPAGYYCDAFGVENPKECLAGFVCPEGSTRGTSEYCKIGWISTGVGSSNTKSCVPCEKGKFCAETGATKDSGKCSAVSITYVSLSIFLSSSTQRLIYLNIRTTNYLLDVMVTGAHMILLLIYKLFAGCQGYYCKGGSWTATPLAGMVHPETGEVVDIGDICPPNHFCIEGVSQPTACPVYAHLCMLVLAEFATNSAEVD